MKVMACIALTVAAVAFGGCSTALRRTAQVTEMAVYPSLACDGFSTHVAVASGNYYETNPMIAGQPSDGALVGYFGFVGGSTFMVNRVTASLLVRRPEVADVVRIAANVGLLVTEALAIEHNLGQRVTACGL
jgi:hypothetical protein